MRSSELSGLRGAGAITLFALSSAIVLGIVFYGVNVAETKRAASALSARGAHTPLARIPALIQREFHASTKMG